MRIRKYLCGIEPANSLVRSREIERKEKILKFIKPSEKISYRLELNILESKKDINNFISEYIK